MEIGDEAVDHPELESRGDEQIGLGIARDRGAVAAAEASRQRTVVVPTATMRPPRLRVSAIAAAVACGIS